MFITMVGNLDRLDRLVFCLSLYRKQFFCRLLDKGRPPVGKEWSELNMKTIIPQLLHKDNKT